MIHKNVFVLFSLFLFGLKAGDFTNVTNKIVPYQQQPRTSSNNGVQVTVKVKHETIKTPQTQNTSYKALFLQTYNTFKNTIFTMPQVFNNNSIQSLQASVIKLNQAMFVYDKTKALQVGFKHLDPELVKIIEQFRPLLHEYNRLLFTRDGQPRINFDYRQQIDIKQLNVEFINTFYQKDAKLIFDALKKHDGQYQKVIYNFNNRDFGYIKSGYQSVKNWVYAPKFKNNISDNAFNKELIEIESLWQKGSYNEAFEKLHNSKIYLHHPQLFEKYNERFLEKVKPILQKARIDFPNHRVRQILIKLQELQAQNKVDAHFLANELSIDHADPQIRQLYHAYFHENGLYKGYENHPLLKDVYIPDEMGTKENTNARTYLHTLLDQKMYDEKVTSQIKTAISYAITSAYEANLKDQYFTLAKAYHDAVVYAQNKEILEIGDLTQLHGDSISNAERDLLVSINSRLIEQSNNTSIVQIKKQIHQTLKTCELMRQAGLAGDHEAALDIYFEELVPQTEQITHFDMHLPTFDELVDKHALAKQTSKNITIDQKAAELSPQYAKRQQTRMDIANNMHATGNIQPQLYVFDPSEFSHKHQLFLSSSAEKMLLEKGLETTKYQFLNGNELQAQATAEAIEVQNTLADLIEKHEASRPLLDLAMTTTDAGLTLAQEGIIQKGFDYIEFGYAAADCVQAVGEGVYEGARDAVVDIASHPIETALTVVAGQYYFYYQLTKLTCTALKVSYDVGSIGITYYINPEQGRQDWDSYVAPIKEVVQQLQEQMKNLETRDVLKFGTKILIQRKVENKMFSALHKYYDGALSKAKELAKKGMQKLPSANPQMVTPEGITFEGTHDVAKETLHLQKQQQLNPDKAAKWANKGKGKTPTRAVQKCGNMYEFFKTKFGQFVKNRARKIKQRYYFKDGRSEAIYQATKDISEHIKTGDYFYFDKLHLDHLEIFGKNKKCKAVINLDGSFNLKKSLAAAERKIQFK